MRARAALLGLGLALAAACGGAPAPSVLVITVDTLRADELGAYGGAGTRTPNLDALARGATVFERASAPMPLTRPSHFSLLTGRYPREHGVLNNAMALPDAATTLAEVLSGHGWRTAAFTGVSLLGRGSGAAQGFERFETSPGHGERSGVEVVAHALDFLASLGPDERFFLWVHLFEPHLPYAPPARFREGLDPALGVAYPSLSWERLQEIAREHGGDVPAPILGHARALYRAEVAAVDAYVGELLSGVAARRGADDVLVVLTADHGECFENGVYFEHADCLWEGALHVPLIVRWPPAFQPGARVSHPVSLVDVAPTVLRAARLDPPPGISGRLLQESAAFADRHVLVEHPFYQERAVTGRRERQDVIRSVAGAPTREILAATEWVGVVGPRWKFLARDGVEELYPLAPRLDESESRTAAEPAVAATMRQILADALSAHPMTRIDPGEVNAELRETLKALGYLRE
jgi:arylsulfatase